MAKITIVIEDGVERGQPVATANFDLDFQGAPEGSPPTDAIMLATAIQRLWRSRALAPLVPLICGDMIRIPGRRLQRAIPEAPAPETVPAA